MLRVKLKPSDDDLLSRPGSKNYTLQTACLALLRQHEAKGELPTSVRFLFYELEQAGVVPKKYPDGKVRSPAQDITDAVKYLRDVKLVPWWWITDETRTLHEWEYAASVSAYLVNTVGYARIDAWAGERPPLIICEARSTMGVLRDLASEYLVPITATNGQCGGFIVTDIVPLLRDDRRVLYIGDYEPTGPGDKIEANTRRTIEHHADRAFPGGEWTKVALTDEQVQANPRLQSLIMTKVANKKTYQAVECEALGQGVLVRLIRDHLDDLLPEPLAVVQQREEEEREKTRAALKRMAKRLH